MTEDDKELEILKAKRLAEMQKNLASQENEQGEKNESNSDKNNVTPREKIIEKLGHRGLEVLTNAESQFPNETRIVEEKLAELIISGEIDEILDGGKLLTLFRSVGIRVRMDNKINVEKVGKFVSISEKFVNTEEKINSEDE